MCQIKYLHFLKDAISLFVAMEKNVFSILRMSEYKRDSERGVSCSFFLMEAAIAAQALPLGKKPALLGWVPGAAAGRGNPGSSTLVILV